MYFECKIKYDKMQENGAVKAVTEAYLCDALSFTEAEAIISERVSPYISGEFTITAEKKTKISEIFDMDADKYWLARLSFVTYDEKTGKEKKSAVQILVGADNFDEAVSRLKEGMRETISDWEINAVEETPILEVFGHQEVNIEKQD